ncbi:outer membrane beta-barrel protein [Sphingomonas yunnanensis]|uniref:outer membrane protein n=1 Tax=Sphingomonas yunnanensis TaxID=310400 RepID=UPI001CA77DB8|nr:outer membrane beta-barrel protein [Sphingomonas yunnanensis]MBY9064068.1 outer membrane beta-barrel protein [Sphingomonas yunnanensis]
MRKFAFATAAAAFGVALATPALAQNGDFSGPRLEALAGYDNLRDGGNGDSEGREGFSYGALLGYDIQNGNIVYGIDGEITDATTKSRSYNEVTAGDRFSVEAGRDLYIGGRLGYVISPAAMIYAKGGYTNARVESRYQPNTGADSELVDKADLDGFRLGAGLEYKLTPTAFVKGEYRYSHYGEIDGYNIDLDRHQLMAGLGIRF